jgi:hypothetical protein
MPPIAAMIVPRYRIGGTADVFLHHEGIPPHCVVLFMLKICPSALPLD